MNKIDEMIRELCPEGVKRVKLVSVAKIQYGYPFESKLFTEDSTFVPLIRIRDVVPGFPSTYYKGEVIDEYIVRNGDMLVGMDGNFNMAKWKGIDGLLNQRVCRISSNCQDVCNGYLYYYLVPMFKHVEEITPGGSVKHLSASIINKLSIPLPPLAIQQEIVSILDSFSSLQSKLEEELAVRQKQMEFYREKLLTFDKDDNSVKWMKLGDVCEICGRIGFRGYTRDDQVIEGKGALALSPSNIVDGKMDFTNCTYISWMKYEESPEIMTFVGDVLFCKTGSTVGKVAYVSELPCESTINPQLVVLKNIKVSPKYLYYYLSSNAIQRQVKSLAGVGSVPNISQSKLQLLDIPMSGEMQEIVSTLDTMSSLIDKLKEEIELRKKQYEYYREALLSF